MKGVLLYIWQLPQTVLGWLLLKTYGWEYRERKRFPNVHIYFCPKFRSAISLGKYIIINPKYNGETTFQRDDTMMPFRRTGLISLEA